jgi:hypothetical protein
MNDRPQGGSAYKAGRIELMINRHGHTQDELGVMEPLRDVDRDGKSLNISATFTLEFTNSKI